MARIGDVDGAAAAIGADHLALEVLDLVDAGVLAHVILPAVVAGHAVLEFVGDDADVVEPGVLDGDGERGIGEVGHFQLVVGDRRDHLRRALVVDRLERVGLAHMLGEILLLQNDRGPVGDRGHPRHADLHRLRAVGAAGGEKAERANAGQREFHEAHHFLPGSPCLRLSFGKLHAANAKIVGRPTDFGKPAGCGVLPAMRYTYPSFRGAGASPRTRNPEPTSHVCVRLWIPGPQADACVPD